MFGRKKDVGTWKCNVSRIIVINVLSYSSTCFKAFSDCKPSSNNALFDSFNNGVVFKKINLFVISLTKVCSWLVRLLSKLNFHQGLVIFFNIRTDHFFFEHYKFLNQNWKSVHSACLSTLLEWRDCEALLSFSICPPAPLSKNCTGMVFSNPVGDGGE